MKNTLLFISILILVTACQQTQKQHSMSTKAENLTSYVNPMIGTSKMGHVFPGATVPFGMVQVSPQTNFEPLLKPDGTYNPATYEYCAGYQYKDTTIIGFAHTNFSGTGHSDLGDVLLMPATGPLVLEPLPTKDKGKGFYSRFSHDTEHAEPGYYSVDLDSYDIKAELTATTRTGFHQYTFPKSDQAHIILDMVYNIYHYDDKNVWRQKVNKSRSKPVYHP